ncbi:MAG: bifunctional hydroxymethylpyrimidine kinase/phosphomethylpyrimidine kinase [Thermodesulfovibrionia bacterium]|nr:bifunctional hydroxymethylpyrimidine kinase/phosphomethylpyrimidine kinase [Thermodesulfovibrionia bacterium]
MKTALTIAGSDPTGGAGLQADLKVFMSLGVYGLSIPSVLTAQNTRGVHDVHEVPADFFSKQISHLLNDIRPDALKTGMIYSPEIVQLIAQNIKEHSLNNLVIDPVTVSSTGVPLIKEGTLEAIKEILFPLAKVVTPNLYEVSLLTGMEVIEEDEMKEAAVKLMRLGPENVIITGGHLQGRAMDLLFDGDDFFLLEGGRVEGDFHGTGCVFSSVITASLALGYDVKASMVKAKAFTLKAIESAETFGSGLRILGI